MPSNQARIRMLMAMVLLLATAVVSPVGAHPEGRAHHNPLPAHATETMRAFAADQESAYTGAGLRGQACTNGLAGGTFPCSNVDLPAHMPLPEIGGTASGEKANDVWGWTDPLTRREYALVGLVFGTSFVDITSPSAPIYLGELPTHGAFGSSWRDIKVYANHAFIVSEASGHGMQVFDLTQLRSVSTPVTFTETAHYDRITSAHNIAINEASGFAYIVGAAGRSACSGGLHMVDIRNPSAPALAGCYGGDGYSHDTQCVIYAGPDAAYRGSEICFSSNEDTVTIVDVTNKTAPVQLSRTPYPGSEYTHQGWLTASQRYFLLDDELDEQRNGHNTRTRVFDVGSLTRPTLVGEFVNPTTPAIDHNQYVLGNRVYQANYRAGLRILDITGVTAGTLAEVGYFDVYPGSDAAQFNGAWSTYPYFASGNVVISSIEQGLFVVTPTGAAVGDGTWVEDASGPGPTPPATMHVGDLDRTATAARGGKWNAAVTITVHEATHSAVAGAAVSGTWSGGATGSASCTTNGAGQCTVTRTNINKNAGSVTFSTGNVVHSGYTYSAAENHDPDGDSTGSTITVTKP